MIPCAYQTVSNIYDAYLHTAGDDTPSTVFSHVCLFTSYRHNGWRYLDQTW